MRRSTMLAVGMLLALCSITRAGDLPLEFSREYEPAVERLKGLYTHVTIEGTLQRERPQEKKSVEQRFVFRAGSGGIRLDVTTLADHGMGLRRGATDMFMATPIGSLSTYRKSPNDVFDNARELGFRDTKTHIDSTCLMNYPYTFGSHDTIYAFLRSSNVRRVEVKTIKHKGETYVRVHYDQVIGHDTRLTDWKSWFLLSPAEGWAVRAYSRTTGEGDNLVTHRGSLSYDKLADGMPMVSRIESIQEQGPKRTCISREIVIVNRGVPGEPPNEYFTAFDF